MKTVNCKPFDLERAKAGDPVITRNGRPVRIICFNRKHDTKAIFILGLISRSEACEELLAFAPEGKALYDHGDDLFMAPVVKKGWINIYPPMQDRLVAYVSHPFKTKEEADDNIRVCPYQRTDCIEVEFKL